MSLILALLPLLSIPVQQEEELELIFVVDSSNSMKRNDPKGLRTQICGAMVDFLGRNRTITVSVVQFAGWNESQAKKVVLLSRSNDLDAVTSSLKEIVAFGDASDINVAFEVGIPRILQARKTAGTRGSLWIVVLTDGEFDVIEESDIRPEYLELAEKDFPELYEEEPDVALNRAALRILFKTLADQYRNIPLILSGINLGKEKVEKESTFHKLVTLGDTRDGKVLQVNQSVLQDVVVPLLMQVPDWNQDRETFYGHRPEGAEVTPFHLYPGSAESNILTWGSSSDYSLKISGVESQLSGTGTSYRLLTLVPSATGDLPLELSGNAAAGVEMLFHVVTELKPDMERTGEENLGGNDKFQATITVRDGRGEIVSGADLAAALSGTAWLTSPGGEPTRSELHFEPDGRAAYAEEVQGRGSNGRYLLDCDVKLNLPGALQTLNLGRSGKPATYLVFPTFTASFEKGEIWLGQPNRLQVNPAPEKPIEITLEGPGSPTLSVGTTGTATLEPGEAGTWSLKDKNYSTFFLKAGETATVKIKPREIRVFQNDKPVESLQADIRFEEEETYPLEIRIEVDRDEKEEATFSLRFEGREGIDLLREGDTVLLQVKTLEDLPAAIGTARITATVSGQEISAELPVTIRYTDRTAKLFKKYLPHLIGAVVALLLLAAFLMLHRFGERQLWVYKEGKIILASHLRDWKSGLAGRTAFGTAEKDRTLLFKMKGMKGFGQASCSVQDVGEPDVYHSSSKIQEKEKREVSHGDEILLSAGLEEWYYFYFDRTPTEEELLSRQAQLEEQDELFLEDE